MATTTATLLIRPRLPVLLSANRRTRAMLDFSVRALSGLYSASRIPASKNLSDALAWLPSQRVPLVADNGTMAVEWYRFFSYLCNTVLGGPTGATVVDVASAVVTSAASVASITQNSSALVQQADANAQAIAAAVQVIQTAALPGSSQIPQVQLTNHRQQL